MDNFTIRYASENIYSYLRQEYNVPWTTSQSDVPVKIYVYSYLRQEYNVPWTTSQSDVPVKIYIVT